MILNWTLPMGENIWLFPLKYTTDNWRSLKGSVDYNVVFHQRQLPDLYIYNCDDVGECPCFQKRHIGLFRSNKTSCLQFNQLRTERAKVVEWWLENLSSKWNCNFCPSFKLCTNNWKNIYSFQKLNHSARLKRKQK